MIELNPPITISRLYEAACVLCQDPNGLILGVSRKNDRTSFSLPGGKLEKGENPILGALRETLEETGYFISPSLDLRISWSMFHINLEKNGELFYCFYVVVPFKSLLKIRDTEESGAVAWVKPSVILQGAFGEYNKEVFDGLGIKIF